MENMANLEIQGGGKPRVTARSGHALVDEIIRAGGIRASVRDMFPAPGSGRGYSADVMLSSILHLVIAGGKTMSDIRVLGRDGLWEDIPLPSEDTIGSWLKRTGTDTGMAALRKVHGSFLSYCMRRTPATGWNILDVDDTNLPCGKAGAMMAYTGEWGFSATTCFTADTGWLVHERFCDGNHRPGANLAVFFDECMAQLPPDRRDGVVLRSDSGGFYKDFIGHLIGRGVGFLIAGRRDSAVCAVADGLSKRAWRRLGQKRSNLLIAETTHSFRGDDRSFRIIFVRRRSEGQQPLLASEELVGIYTTNLGIPAEEVTKLYRKRGDCENRIKEYKSDLAAGRPPCSQKEPNAVWARVNAIAYNVAALMRNVLFRHERHGVSTIRWKVLEIAGTVVRHARRWILRVTNEHAQSLRAWREQLAG